LSGRWRYLRGKANKSGRDVKARIDSVFSGASLQSMDTLSNPDLRAKLGVNHDEWFLREVNKGLAAADRGELVDHSDVRKLIDERYPV
jgi:predicted transcriptional regulator